MEIGGFITEGAEIVNHDNTLSGNGTVDSPLGVSETVLWSGARQTTGSIQLSESMWNYGAMDIYVCPDYNSYSAYMGYQISRLTVIPQTGTQQLLCYAKSDRIDSNTYLSELFYLRFNPNGDSVTFSPGIKRSNNTVTTGVTAFNGAVTKIVGINRIANN